MSNLLELKKKIQDFFNQGVQNVKQNFAGNFNPLTTLNSAPVQKFAKVLPQQAKSYWLEGQGVTNNPLFPKTVKPYVKAAVQYGPASFMSGWSKGVGSIADNSQNPLQRGANIAGAAYQTTNPFKTIQGGILGIPFNYAANTLGNVINGQPVGTNFDPASAYQQGFEFQSKLGPVEGLTSPITSPILNTLIKGKGIIPQLTKAGFQAGIPMGFLGATEEAKNGREMVNNVLSSFAQGFVFGAGTKAIGMGIGKFKDLTTYPTGVINQLRDSKGRWTVDKQPTKPQGMGQKQWEFQIAFNERYGRNPYVPVYQTDLQGAIQYEAGKRTGMQVRDVNKDLNPLNSPKEDLVQSTPPKGVGVKTPQTKPQKELSNQNLEVLPVESKSVKTKAPSNQISSETIIPQGMKERGLVTSVQEAPNVPKTTKAKVEGLYTPKADVKLMGEANALLTEGATIDFKNVEGIDKKVAATIQQAVNLDKSGSHEAAANLYNNLSEHGTELGRGVHAFDLLNKMSPEAISLSAAGKIKAYNRTATRKIPELTGEQVKMISDQVAKIDKLTGREKNIAINDLQTVINEFIPSTLVDKAITVWKAGLLTSLRTHERNLLGNTIMGGFENLKDIPASVADILMSAKTGKRSMTYTNKGVVKGTIKGLKAAKDIVTTGFDPEASIEKFDVHRVTWGKNPVEQVLKKYTDFVFRTLGGEDKPFWNASFARSLYDQAGTEAINVGKQGNKVFIEKLVNKPTENMLKTATIDANYATFHDTSRLSEIANAFKRTMGKNEITKGVSEVLAPFTGVPSSIVGKTVAYSPIGLVKGAWDTGRVFLGKVPIPELQRQAAQEVGRGVMGTGLFALGAYLMNKGLMTGQPKNAAEANQWALENKPYNSVMLWGKWRGINSIGPQNLILLAGAKYAEETNPGGGGIGAYGGQLAKDQLSQTFLSGVQGPLNAITDPARYGPSYIGNQASSVIPNIIKDTSKAFDPYARETGSVGDYMKLGIPGLRNTLTPKRDVLGNIIPQQPTGASAYVDLLNSKTPIKNPVVDELSRLNSAQQNSTPSKLQKSQTINGVKQTLTPEQLNNLEAEVGPQLTQQLDSLFRSGGYKTLSDEDKANAVDSVVKSVRKKVTGTIDMSQTTPNPSGLVPEAKASTSSIGGQYILVNQDTGSVKKVDLSQNIEYPTKTGNETVDKILLSSYRSDLNTRIKDVIALYQDKQITVEQMAKEVDALQAKYDSSKPKKLKKLSVPKLSIKGLKIKSSKTKKYKMPKTPTFKLATVKTPTLKVSVPKTKYTLKTKLTKRA